MIESSISTNKKSVAFLTLGCKVNSYETDAMRLLFEQAGYTVVDFNQSATIYVVNTCTVTNIADRKSRQMLHRAKKLNKDAVVVAVGCYVQAAKEALLEDEAIDVVVGNNQKNQIVTLVENYINQIEDTVLLDISKETEYEELSIGAALEKTRAYIKIQDGCNQFCSYCIIPYTRGRVRSRKQADIFLEVKKMVELGFKEVVLTGIHLSSYGIDLDEEGVSYNAYMQEDVIHPLLLLIEQLSELEDLKRIRLGSLEPRIITNTFVERLAKLDKFCPHFHLSLQSGCDETLARMNRKYTTGVYYEKCELLRSVFDRPAITTDVIVGFPGETMEEFEKTKLFLEKVSFSQMHIFKYSKRKGTRAESMENQVSEELKTKRSNELFQLEAKLRKNYQDSFVGTEQIILIEEEQKIDDKIYQIGHTERYLKVAIPTKQDISNQFKKVKLLAHLNEDVLLGKIID